MRLGQSDWEAGGKSVWRWRSCSVVKRYSVVGKVLLLEKISVKVFCAKYNIW